MDGKMVAMIYRTAQDNNIIPLTSVCNVNCIFCSHRQNPKEVRAISVPPLSLELVEGLVDFLDPKRKIIIGESTSLIMEGEPFTHPNFFEVLDLIREHLPQTPIQITTNGSLLTENVVSRLLDYQPIELNLSLNSANEAMRKKLMADRNCEVSCRAPQLLQQYGVNYHGSIVAMPHITGWEDLSRTIEYLIHHGAKTIRIFKPGFTKLTHPKLVPGIDDLRRLEQLIAQLQNNQCPLTLEPCSIEDLNAIVEGVIQESPADKSGIQGGDHIVSINGQKPFSRVDAYTKLKENGKYQLIVQRGESFIEKELVVHEETSGLVFHYDLSQSEVESLRRVLDIYHKKNVLMLVSQLAYSRWNQGIGESDGVKVRPTKSLFFGGNIQAAGLLTLIDFRHEYQEYIREEGMTPEVVILPSIAFDLDERDLTGAYLWEWEEEIESKVILL